MSNFRKIVLSLINVLTFLSEEKLTAAEWVELDTLLDELQRHAKEAYLTNTNKRF